MANELKRPTFTMSDKELAEAIEKYKADVENEVIVRASWSHFCSRLDCTEADLAEVIEYDKRIEKSAYNNRAVMIKKMMTWMRGQLLSSRGWNGQNTSKAIFCLKQDMGDGVSYNDKDAGSGKVQVDITIGAGDKRSELAAK